MVLGSRVGMFWVEQKKTLEIKMCFMVILKGFTQRRSEKQTVTERGEGTERSYFFYSAYFNNSVLHMQLAIPTKQVPRLTF